METLPPELQMMIYRFTKHPAAELITQAIEDHDKYLHKMAKMNRMSYEVISKDPDFMFHPYLRYEFICRNMVDYDYLKFKTLFKKPKVSKIYLIYVLFLGLK